MSFIHVGLLITRPARDVRWATGCAGGIGELAIGGCGAGGSGGGGCAGLPGCGAILCCSGTRGCRGSVPGLGMNGGTILLIE